VTQLAEVTTVKISQCDTFVGHIMLVTMKFHYIEGSKSFLTLSSRMIYIYICRAGSPLNSRTATKVAGAGGGFISGENDLIPASKG
jgi:hypothetical protein